MPSVPAIAARITRDRVLATGPDTIAFLQGQLSQDIEGLAVGATAWSFLLQPQGKVDAWMRVHRRTQDEVSLDVDGGWGPAVVARLERFKLRTKCELELETDLATVAVRGTLVSGGLPCGWPGVEGEDVIGTDEWPPDLPEGTALVDAAAYQALRITHGVPAMGAELTSATIPAEVGQWVVDASVSFTKGCFTGQELVARIDSRGGNVPRRLRGFVSSGLLPAAGTEVLAGEGPVGVVTSAAVGLDGTVVGLAMIKRSAEPPFRATIAGSALDEIEVRALPLT